MGGNSEREGRIDIEMRGNVLYGADRQVTQWVADHCPGYCMRGGTRALGIVVKGKMAGGVVYENFNGLNIDASIAGDSSVVWLNRDTLYQIFAYPFLTLNCVCMTVLVAMTNTRSLRFVQKLGFEGEAIVRFAAHDGSDLVVLKMFRENCRWIKDETLKHASTT